MSSGPAPHPRYCDVVMKGGITSGVVYPRAVTEIARHFGLKSVGGTSAGAIAAAAAAAAEARRVSGKGAAGFDALDALPAFLQAHNASGHTNLFTMFQPHRRTRRLFNTLTATLDSSSSWSAACFFIAAAMWNHLFFAVIGAAPGAYLIWRAWDSSADLATIVATLGWILFVTGLVAAPVIAFALKFLWRVPAHFFGLCSGMPTSPHEPSVTAGGSRPEALVEWLTHYLNDVAGLQPNGSPLTFGQLWQPAAPAGTAPPAGTPRAVNLQMISTCLSWGRPFRLPFQDEAEAKENRFYFLRSEFDQLFPATVVDWLVSHPRDSKLPQRWRDAGYVPFPDPWNLPVVVATRMSLSFPLLLSAIPLHAYEHGTGDDYVQQHPPTRCWFSDGGLCSNFPMHLFDAPIPRWPTFAINLMSKPAGTPAEELAKPWMPASNGQGIQETRHHFDNVFTFLWTIIGTMQNWSDNSVSRLPGYRDRIAHVKLTPDEGGLNLNMPKQRIDDLCQRGAATGREFVRRFGTDDEPVMNWPNHRWLRVRSMIASIEEMADRIDRACAEPLPPDADFETWIRDTPLEAAPSYQWTNQGQRDKALRTLAALRQVSAMWREETPGSQRVSAGDGAPRPRPELRPRARI